MNKRQLISTLESVIQQAWGESDLGKAKNLVISHIRESKVKDEDKTRIETAIAEISSKPRFDYYLANALLKFEGHGVRKVKSGGDIR